MLVTPAGNMFLAEHMVKDTSAIFSHLKSVRPESLFDVRNQLFCVSLNVKYTVVPSPLVKYQPFNRLLLISVKNILLNIMPV